MQTDAPTPSAEAPPAPANESTLTRFDGGGYCLRVTRGDRLLFHGHAPAPAEGVGAFDVPNLLTEADAGKPIACCGRRLVIAGWGGTVTVTLDGAGGYAVTGETDGACGEEGAG